MSNTARFRMLTMKAGRADLPSSPEFEPNERFSRRVPGKSGCFGLDAKDHHGVDPSRPIVLCCGSLESQITPAARPRAGCKDAPLPVEYVPLAHAQPSCCSLASAAGNAEIDGEPQS